MIHARTRTNLHLYASGFVRVCVSVCGCASTSTHIHVMYAQGYVQTKEYTRAHEYCYPHIMHVIYKYICIACSTAYCLYDDVTFEYDDVACVCNAFSYQKFMVSVPRLKVHHDGAYKYIGGVLGSNGLIYFVPSSADNIGIQGHRSVCSAR